MTRSTKKITPLRTTWQQLMLMSGNRAPRLRNSLIGLALAALVQGVALTCMMPIFYSVLHGQTWSVTLFWLATMTIFSFCALAIRWKAQDFDYNGDMVLTTHELRTKLGEKLRQIPLEKLQNIHSGEIDTTILGDVDDNANYIITIANQLASAIITPLTVGIITFFFDWRLALLLLLIFPALVPLYRWRRPAFGRGMKILNEAKVKANTQILEYTQGMAVLRATGCVGDKAQRLNESIENLEKVQTIGQIKGTKPNILVISLMELGLLAVISIGAAFVFFGSTDIALLAALLVIIVRFNEPLSIVILLTLIIDLMETALKKIQALLIIEPLAALTPLQSPHSFNINFDDVTFSYERSPDNIILRHINLRIPERSLTAFVGPSGAGKTTLTRLIMRHFDATAGNVTIGDVDIRSIEPSKLNSLISVVFQDVYLFNDTIRENIRMSRPSASDAEVEAAARAAHCHEFIERFPQGYDTKVEELGGRLSGGERQRISIARAILKDAPIVILDEPTAALDTESEVAVQQAINGLVENKTVIVIAHRLSTIAAADQIIVVDGGKIVEQGKHDELLATDGRYASMWHKQQIATDWHASV